MTADAETYARIAREVEAAHLAARKAFLARLAREQAAIARTALEQSEAARAILEDGRPRAPERLRAALIEAEAEQARNILDTIARAPSPVLERMAGLRVSIGTALPDRPTSLSASLLRGQADARARTAGAFEPAARFRARVGPARELVVAQVRQGLAAGASVRQTALAIRAEGSPPPVIPAYVQAVLAELHGAGAVAPGAFEALAGDVRAALRKLGSATDAQSWRTIRPTVTRLARALESGNVDRVRAAVENFTETKMRFEAGRIARTESARAASRAQIESAQSTPGVTALKWDLSREHPVEDICDVFAQADLYGLGPGMYPLDQPPELPAHPNCLCSLSPVLTVASIRRAIRGEPHPPAGPPRDTSPEAWLLRQPPAVQARVVGVGASERMREGARVFAANGQILPARRVG